MHYRYSYESYTQQFQKRSPRSIIPIREPAGSPRSETLTQRLLHSKIHLTQPKCCHETLFFPSKTFTEGL
jgi:hypothetical protein